MSYNEEKNSVFGAKPKLNLTVYTGCAKDTCQEKLLGRLETEEPRGSSRQEVRGPTEKPAVDGKALSSGTSRVQGRGIYTLTRGKQEIDTDFSAVRSLWSHRTSGR